MTAFVTAFLLADWVYNSAVALYVCLVAAIIVVILSENRSPVKSLAWVTVLIAMPLFGVILYIFFGRSLRNKRMISRANRRRLKRAERFRPVDINHQGLSENSLQHVRLARAIGGALFYPGNHVTVFTNGTSKFAAFERDLAAARQYINLQYYIFEDDNIGTRIRDILIDRARAGVKVRLIYDNVGSFNTSRRFFNEMTKAGIEVYPFFKVYFPPFGTRINWRNHRKLCIIDGEVGYIGGMNIADRYIDGGKDFESWRDTHLRVTGPVIGALQYSFAVDWSFMGRPLISETIDNNDPEPDGIGMQMVTSGPTSTWSNVELMFLHCIASAKHRIYIQTPYFLPTDGLLKALQTAALSNVDVRIMLPRRSDSRMLQLASNSYLTECLRSGIKFYFYTPGMLHSKSIIIDDDMATVGSANFDFRSFEHNFEANMFIYSKDFNNRMAEIFLADMRHSIRVMPANWRRRPYILRIAESAIRIFAPIL